jgi:hypothetical protein
LDPTRTRSLEYMREGMQDNAPEVKVARANVAAPRADVLSG